MNCYFIEASHFKYFINNMIEALPIYAPQLVPSKTHKADEQEFFSFEKLTHENELRLDYDTTILPPKKLFFPPKQVILEFNKNEFTSTIKPVKQILMGVHPDDLKAIEQTDYLFTENHEDINYTAYRQATTLVGSNFQSIAKHAFWGSIPIDSDTHDAFLTHLDNGYLFEVLTAKGYDLLYYGHFVPATGQQLKQAQHLNEISKNNCPEKISYSISEISTTLRQSFSNDKLWDELAKDCFSCGSCNMVCPTCYCFNIEDNWNIDQVSGQRTRYWDSCMTEDFAKISLGNGQTENFRPTTGSRMRHRIMRKMVYLNKKLGNQACVGCGRCSSTCTADIANPVDIINRIMTESHNE